MAIKNYAKELDSLESQVSKASDKEYIRAIDGSNRAIVGDQVTEMRANAAEIIKSLETVQQKFERESIKLEDAFLFGGISADQYGQALDRLKRQTILADQVSQLEQVEGVLEGLRNTIDGMSGINIGTLMDMGATKEQIQQAKSLFEQIDISNEMQRSQNLAEQLMAKYESSSDKLKRKLEEIETSLAYGDISQEIFDREKAALEREAMGTNEMLTNRRVGAMEMGSSSAFSAIASNRSPLRKLEDSSKENVKETRKSNMLLAELANKNFGFDNIQIVSF